MEGNPSQGMGRAHHVPLPLEGNPSQGLGHTHVTSHHIYSLNIGWMAGTVALAPACVREGFGRGGCIVSNKQNRNKIDVPLDMFSIIQRFVFTDAPGSVVQRPGLTNTRKLKVSASNSHWCGLAPTRANSKVPTGRSPPQPPPPHLPPPSAPPNGAQ